MAPGSPIRNDEPPPPPMRGGGGSAICTGAKTPAASATSGPGPPFPGVRGPEANYTRATTRICARMIFMIIAIGYTVV